MFRMVGSAECLFRPMGQPEAGAPEQVAVLLNANAKQVNAEGPSGAPSASCPASTSTCRAARTRRWTSPRRWWLAATGRCSRVAETARSSPGSTGSWRAPAARGAPAALRRARARDRQCRRRDGRSDAAPARAGSRALPPRRHRGRPAARSPHLRRPPHPFAGVGVDAAVVNDYYWIRDRLSATPLRRLGLGAPGYGLAVALRSAPRYLLERRAAYCEIVNVGRAAWRLDARGERVGRPIAHGAPRRPVHDGRGEHGPLLAASPVPVRRPRPGDDAAPRGDVHRRPDRPHEPAEHLVRRVRARRAARLSRRSSRLGLRATDAAAGGRRRRGLARRALRSGWRRTPSRSSTSARARWP